MLSSGMLRRVALVRTEVSEELSGSIIMVTRIGELGAMLILKFSQGKWNGKYYQTKFLMFTDQILFGNMKNTISVFKDITGI
jgi:hypothetical protein